MIPVQKLHTLQAVIKFCHSYFFFRPKGSDCGIVNINIPTNGAEIGGAFGMCNAEKYSIRFFKINILCDTKFYTFFKIIVITLILNTVLIDYKFLVIPIIPDLKFDKM